MITDINQLDAKKTYSYIANWHFILGSTTHIPD